MQKLIDTLKNTIFKFEVSISSCQPDEGTFHLEFEDEKYSQKSLLNLIKRSVMYFALTPQEFKDMSSNEIHEMNPTAWTRISTAHRNSKGDYGELLLYLILIAFYPTERFVTKVRLRSNQKDQIKGFDCAHFTVDEHNNLSFWLGEAKFRNKFSDAVQDAFSSLKDHCNYNFIKSEFRILAPNLEINKESPQYDRLMSALRAERSLDNLQFVFPILVTYDSTAVKKSKSVGDEFKRYLEAEIKKKYEYIRRNWLTTKPNFRFIFILFPLETISDLKSELEGIENAERDRD